MSERYEKLTFAGSKYKSKGSKKNKSYGAVERNRKNRRKVGFNPAEFGKYEPLSRHA